MKKILFIIALIVVLIIVGLAFYAIGFKAGIKKGESSMENRINQYKEILDYYNPISENIYDIFGEVTDIQNKTLSVETTVREPYTLPENWPKKIIKVQVTDETKINKYDTKTGQAIKAYFSEIKKGEAVNVGAQENIKDLDEFEATLIELFGPFEAPE